MKMDSNRVNPDSPLDPTWMKIEVKGKDGGFPMKIDEEEEKSEKVSESDAEAVDDDDDEEEEEEEEGPVIEPEDVYIDDERVLDATRCYYFWPLPVGDFEDQEETAKYNKYVADYNASEGFDIDNFCYPMKTYMLEGVFRPVLLGDERDSYCTDNINKALKVVLKNEKRKNKSNLELVEIIKAYVRRFSTYHITFKAVDKDTGEVRTYQCKVNRNACSQCTRILLFREKQ